MNIGGSAYCQPYSVSFKRALLPDPHQRVFSPLIHPNAVPAFNSMEGPRIESYMPSFWWLSSNFFRWSFRKSYSVKILNHSFNLLHSGPLYQSNIFFSWKVTIWCQCCYSIYNLQYKLANAAFSKQSGLVTSGKWCCYAWLARWRSNSGFTLVLILDDPMRCTSRFSGSLAVCDGLKR